MRPTQTTFCVPLRSFLCPPSYSQVLWFTWNGELLLLLLLVLVLWAVQGAL